MDKPIMRPLSEGEVEICAGLMSSSEPWITLKRGPEECRRLLKDPEKEKYVAEMNNCIAGILILVMKGAFVGYIQTVFVAPEFRGQGIGSFLLRYAEDRIFCESPNVFICVSSFNKGARRFYERMGYEVVGELRDYIIKGLSEILLRKTIGPAGSFRTIT